MEKVIEVKNNYIGKILEINNLVKMVKKVLYGVFLNINLITIGIFFTKIIENKKKEMSLKLLNI